LNFVLGGNVYIPNGSSRLAVRIPPQSGVANRQAKQDASGGEPGGEGVPVGEEGGGGANGEAGSDSHCLCAINPSACWLFVISRLVFLVQAQEVTVRVPTDVILVPRNLAVDPRLDECHLAQDSYGINNLGVHSNEPSTSALIQPSTQNVLPNWSAWQTVPDIDSTGSANSPFYHGWYYWDEPRLRYRFSRSTRMSRGFKGQAFWQARAYLEENPQLENWWGYAFTAPVVLGKFQARSSKAEIWSDEKKQVFFP